MVCAYGGERSIHCPFLIPFSNQLTHTHTQGLDQYYSALQARSRLIQETDSLRQQNMELRLLLQQYMHAHINQELEVPPTLMLPVP